MRRFAVLSLFLAFAVTVTTAAHADWEANGVPVVTGAGSSYTSGLVSDGAGGAIITWQDNRSGTTDVYAQRIDANGNPLWAHNGALVCGAAGPQELPRICSDGAGGAIITWVDSRSGDEAIYAQRVSAGGLSQWAANGIVISDLVGIQFLQEMVADGAGGAFITWVDRRSGTNWDIYAQRVNASGVVQWTANGVPVTVAAQNQLYPQLIDDGAGGIIITWADIRDGAKYHIYAQRFSGLGTPQWAANGVIVSGMVGNQVDVALVSDGVGGAFIVWQDDAYAAPERDIVMNRIDTAGNVLWAFPTLVCQAAGDQEYPDIVNDGAGGAIVTWDDYRDTVQFDVYAQRVDQSGGPMWTYDGVPICTSSGHQQNPRIVSDGSGGAVIAWNDSRSGVGTDIFARQVNASGSTVWQYDGMPVSTASISQSDPYLVDDGTNGVIIAFNDNRSGYSHVYAQRMEKRYGYWGRPEPAATSANDNPGDQGGLVILRWDASQRDRFDNPAITHYSVWRSTDNVAAAGAGVSGSPTLRVMTPAEIGPGFGGRAVWEEITAAGPAYWEWVANQGALYQQTYSMLAPTRQDETFGVPAPNYFKVIAHESEYSPSRTWESGVVSGSSIDNLSPPVPFQLTGERGGNNVYLSWTGGSAAPDFLTYRVYRSTSGDVMPSPGFLLIASDDPSYVDTSAPAGALHYVVTAIDIHGNESGPSNVIGVFDATGVGDDTPALRVFTVLPNHPNPFNGDTELRVGLPAKADIAVEVFDVAGRRVRVLREPGATAGWHDLRFDGRDDTAHPLPGGVYFYRVTAAGKTATGKMVITR